MRRRGEGGGGREGERNSNQRRGHSFERSGGAWEELEGVGEGRHVINTALMDDTLNFFLK